MANNSTNINKTNNHLSLQPHWTPRHMTLHIHVLVWDRHRHVAGLNRLTESNLPLLITGSTTIIHITKKLLKNCTDSLPLKKTIYYHKYEWQLNMDFAINNMFHFRIVNTYQNYQLWVMKRVKTLNVRHRNDSCC